MRAVGYVRVSSEEQVDGLSLDAQRSQVAAYCERHGYELVRVYADEGISAYTDRIAKRPALSRLLQDAEQGGFDLVVVHTIDRWARNLRVQLDSLSRLGAANVGFASITEAIDYTTPAGRLTLTMLGSVSEFQSAQTGVHVRKAHEYRAKMLGLPVGSLPIGYVAGDDGIGRIDPVVGPAIRAAFEARAAGDAYQHIADRLNAAGIRTARGAPFAWESVRDLFATRYYVGVVTYRGEDFPGKHEPLVPEAIYERVQARRERRDRARTRTYTSLAGIVHCARCARALRVDRTGEGTPQYRERHRYPCDTRERSIVASVIDGQLGQLFASIELTPAMVEYALTSLRKQDGGELDALRAQRRRVARTYMDGAIGEMEYRTRIMEIDGRMQAAAPVDESRITEIAAVLGDLGMLWAEATVEERHALLRPLVDAVYVDLDERRVVGVEAAPDAAAMLRLASVKAGSKVRLAPAEALAGESEALVEMGGELTSLWRLSAFAFAVESVA